jgi:hypothetical protein
LSDGCSGEAIAGEPGSPYTDFGARFLVRSALRSIEELATGVFPAKAIIRDALAISTPAGLPSVSLDATLLVAIAVEDGPVTTFRTGDGVIAYRERDGSIHYESVEFGNGMPYYLNYLACPARQNSLVHPRPEELGSDEAMEAAGTVVVTMGTWRPGMGWLEPRRWKERFDETTPIERKTVFKRDQVDLVLLLSDGVESFQSRDRTGVPLERILEQLFDFKGLSGEFLVRRCSRFLQRFCVDNGWRHEDDFSVAGIYLG